MCIRDRVMSLGDLGAKLRAFGFDLVELPDGNDLDAVEACLLYTSLWKAFWRPVRTAASRNCGGWSWSLKSCKPATTRSMTAFSTRASPRLTISAPKPAVKVK